MKNILLILIAIVAAIIIFLPKYISVQFASGLQATIDTVNAKSSYKVSIEEINSGWASTQAVLNVALKMPNLDVNPTAMTDATFNIFTIVEVNASHGPILSSGDSLVGLLHTVISTQNASMPASIVLASNDAPVFKIDASTALFGGTDFISQIVGLTYTDTKSGMVVSFSGLQSQGRISSNGYTFTGNTESIVAGSGEVQIAAVNNITIETTSDLGMIQMITQGLYNSESTISIADIVFTSVLDGSLTTVTDSKMLATTTLDEATDMGDITIKTTMAQFDAMDINIADLLVVMDVKNLQAKFMRAYQDFSVNSMDYVTDPAAMQNAMQAFLDSHLLEQLQHNPEYNISVLSGKIGAGKVDIGEFNGRLMTKLANITELPDTMENSDFWMQHANVDAQMTMQKGAAEFFVKQFIKTQIAGSPEFLGMNEDEQQQVLTQQTQATLGALVQQGMLMADGEDYKFTFTLKEAAAALNGEPMPLPL